MTAAIVFSGPLWICLLSIPLLGEQVGPRRWAAIVVGFCGVLVVTRPWSGAVHWAVALSIGAALCGALYSILTRLLAGRDSTGTQQFYAALVATLGTAPLALADWSLAERGRELDRVPADRRLRLGLAPAADHRPPLRPGLDAGALRLCADPLHDRLELDDLRPAARHLGHRRRRDRRRRAASTSGSASAALAAATSCEPLTITARVPARSRREPHDRPQIVLVTGASQGIGAATARAFAGAGYAWCWRPATPASSTAVAAGSRRGGAAAGRCLRRDRSRLGRGAVRADPRASSGGSTWSSTTPAPTSRRRSPAT